MKENWYILQIMPDAEKYGRLCYALVPLEGDDLILP